MTPQTFAIKSLFIQNAIMLFSLGAVGFLLVRSLIRRKPKHIGVFSIWVLIVIWFFNSPFFGFSVVRLSPSGIRLDYGVLSFRNTILPIDSPWKVEMSLSGLRKTKRLYFLRIDDRASMKIQGKDDFEMLQKIGDEIERMKAHH